MSLQMDSSLVRQTDRQTGRQIERQDRDKQHSDRQKNKVAVDKYIGKQKERKT